MSKFKPGDVVRHYGDYSYIGIVGEKPPPSDARKPAFRYAAIRWRGHVWQLNESWDLDKSVILHPDPDEVWAEYCAWRLTNA